MSASGTLTRPLGEHTLIKEHMLLSAIVTVGILVALVVSIVLLTGGSTGTAKGSTNFVGNLTDTSNCVATLVVHAC